MVDLIKPIRDVLEDKGYTVNLRPQEVPQVKKKEVTILIRSIDITPSTLTDYYFRPTISIGMVRDNCVDVIDDVKTILLAIEQNLSSTQKYKFVGVELTLEGNAYIVFLNFEYTDNIEV